MVGIGLIQTPVGWLSHAVSLALDGFTPALSEDCRVVESDEITSCGAQVKRKLLSILDTDTSSCLLLLWGHLVLGLAHGYVVHII